MNDILNLQLRLACMSTFFMPRQICKVLSQLWLGILLGPLLVRSLLILPLKKILNTFLNIRPLLVCASPSFGEINTT
ncbi:hypothetical protein EJD97_023168 [Solanum chilense]|uniref:Uncharacterized protein n=1 Tax=Solanum chilense TaxID=4083 RepID=A0A6N2ADE2_SOLCI|nr:hypothetical protein EJD97_023168 [Solanum chilense]